jgi:ketosteroid isomerase-like protein
MNAQTSGAEVLKQIEHEWVEAQKVRNTDRVAEILADDWVGLGRFGKTSDKARVLARMKAEPPHETIEHFEVGPITVHIFGDAAVVMGSQTEKSTRNGKNISGKYAWMDVFVMRDGKWKAVASQSAKVPE